jgi:hypothetical protein
MKYFVTILSYENKAIQYKTFLDKTNAEKFVYKRIEREDAKAGSIAHINGNAIEFENYIE